MNKNKTVRAFRRRLLLEGLLKALAVALCLALGAGLLFTLVCHLLLIKTALLPFFLTIAGVLLFSFPFVFFIGHFPTLKKTARRMDEMGLKDRTVTMLENENNQSVMARLQREDAKKQMGSLRARKMKLRLSGKVLAALLCLLVLTSGLFALPHDLLRFGKEASAEGMDEEQQQIIKDLIDKLRDETEKAPLDEELKEDIRDVVDRLEGELNKTDDALEQAGKVEDAKNELSQRFDKELSKNTIGKALQQYDLTKNTGVAVSDGNTEQLKSAFDALEGALGHQKELKDELYKTINRALDESDAQPGDPLYDAFAELSYDLAELDSEREDYEKALGEIFERAYATIAPLLEKQEEIEDEKEKFEEILDKGKEELLEKGDQKAEEEGKKPGEGEKPGDGDKPGDGEKPGDGDKPGDGQGEKPGGEKPGNGDKPGNGGGDEKDPTGGGQGGEDPENGQKEPFYDPFLGNVSYGEVLAAYYAEYLKAVENGTVAPDVKEFVEQYFSSLND